MRKKISARIEKDILVNSGRRCCICFGLHKDFSVKHGQIAHIDRDPKNNAVENLVFLCLDHHNEYDSRFKQTKGFTAQEVINYRNSLLEKVHRDIKTEDLYKEELDIEAKKADQVLSIIEKYQSIGSFKSSIIIKDEILGRFRKICECSKRVSEMIDQLAEKGLSDDEIGEQCDMYEKDLIATFGIPNNIWGISSGCGSDAEWLAWVEDIINIWAEGKCSFGDCRELLWALDEEYDLDYTYILYGISLKDLDRLACAALISFTFEFGLRASDPDVNVSEVKFDDSSPIKF